MNLEEYFRDKGIAVFGVSSKKKKFGNYIYEKLIEFGYSAYAINPNAEVKSEINFYDSIHDLENVTSLVFVTKPNVTNQILRNEIPEKVEFIWIQQGAGNFETEQILKAMNLEFVYNKCLIMYLEPVKGIHKFHRKITELFGGLVK